MFVYLKSRWGTFALCAQSIGVWFSLLAFENEPFERCLFIAPILDMELLIRKMIAWAGVSESQLEKERIIPTGFGQELSWEYFKYAQKHKIERWNKQTFILYPENDSLTGIETARNFAKAFGCQLTIAEGGEHWFRTPQQLEILHRWMEGHC